MEKSREEIWNPLEIDQKVRPFFFFGKWDIFRRLWGKAGTQRSKESAAEAWQAFTVTAEAPCCSVHAVWRLLQAEKCLSWEVCVCQRQRPTSMDGWLGAHRWGGGTTFRERLFYSPGELTCRCSSSCVTCFDSTAKNGSEKKPIPCWAPLASFIWDLASDIHACDSLILLKANGINGLQHLYSLLRFTAEPD